MVPPPVSAVCCWLSARRQRLSHTRVKFALWGARFTNSVRTTSDGVDIAYAVLGNGPPLIVASGIWTSHLTVSWREIGHGISDLARHFTVIRYDGRGLGLSDRKTLDFSLAARVRDIEAVVAATGSERFVLYGAAHACLAAVAYAAENPNRLSRLVLSGPYSSGDEFYKASPRMKFVASLGSVTEEQWDFVAATMAARVASGDEARARYLTHLIKSAIGPDALLAFRDANREIDLTDLLSKSRRLRSSSTS